MNSQSTSVNYAGSESKPASKCDIAYDQLRQEQESVAAAVKRLTSALEPVLRGDLKAGAAEMSAGISGVVPEGPASEIHGRFLAARDHARGTVGDLEDLIARLTI